MESLWAEVHIITYFISAFLYIILFGMADSDRI